MLIVNIGVAFFYFWFSFSWIASDWFHFPLWSLQTVAALAALNVLLLIFLFRWKAWAFYGLVVVALANFALNTSVGFGIGLALAGLVGPAVLSLLLFPKRRLFK